MSRRAFLLAAAVALGACGHARQVATPPPPSALPAVQTDSSGVPFATAPEGLLRPGAVRTIQAHLHDQGLLPAGHESGQFDPATREALRRFQAKNDLPATGLPSYRTVEKLRLPPDQIFFSAQRPPQPGARKEAAETGAAVRTTP